MTFEELRTSAFAHVTRVERRKLTILEAVSVKIVETVDRGESTLFVAASNDPERRG